MTAIMREYAAGLPVALRDRLMPETGIARITGRIEERAWDTYVTAHAESTFFHRFGWCNVLRNCFNFETYYLAAWRSGHIVGIVPLVRINSRLFGDRLSSMPFGVYGGPLADDADTYFALANEAARLARDLGVEYLEFKSRFPTYGNNGWLVAANRYVTYRRALPSFDGDEIDDEGRRATLMSWVPAKRRNMVRKGVKHNLIVCEDDTPDRFYTVYAESLRNLGTPVLPYTFFWLVYEEFGTAVEITTVTTEAHEPVTSAMSFYHGNEVTPFYSGGTPLARSTAAFDFMYFELMMRAIERGVTVYDFGRSRVDTGAGDFKQLWGFMAEPLYYEYLMLNGGALPENNPTNPKYRTAIALWKRLPLPLATMLGAKIAPVIG